MKIAIVCAATGTGGIERVVTMLARQWVESGHTVRLLAMEAPSARPAFDLDHRVTLEQLDLSAGSASYARALWNNLRRVAVLRQRLRSFAPDITLAQAAEPSILAILAGVGQRWPTIATEQTHPAHHYLPGPWRTLRRVTYRWADAIVVQTNDIAGWITGSLRLDAHVIPNPIDLTRFKAAPAAAPAPPRNRRRAIAVGRLSPEKGYDLLIPAFARAAKLHPEWDLFIHGDGPERANLEAMVRSLDLQGRIVLAGNTPEVERAYRDADLFVHASRYEGYPNAIQEALAASKPVIATDCPGAARQLLGAGRYGVLVPSGDADALSQALTLLMADGERRAALARSARDAVVAFEAGHIAQRWLELFRQTVGRKTAGRKGGT
jgi:glycosyltransferase involved in cell wall biosynthesis